MEEISKRSSEVLINDVQHMKEIGTWDDGDNWGLPLYNCEERLEAVKELGRRGDKAAVPALIKYFYWNLSRIEHLRGAGTALIAILGEKEFDVRVGQEVLDMVKEDVVEMEMSYAADQMSDKLVKMHKEFGDIGNWRESLFAELKGYPKKRRYEHDKFGKNRSFGEYEINELDKNYRLEQLAVYTLGKLNDQRVLKFLIASLKTENYGDAIGILGTMKNPDAVEPLVDLLEKRDHSFNFQQFHMEDVKKALKDITGKDFGSDYIKLGKRHNKRCKNSDERNNVVKKMFENIRCRLFPDR